MIAGVDLGLPLCMTSPVSDALGKHVRGASTPIAFAIPGQHQAMVDLIVNEWIGSLIDEP
jgi:hypothetical protein